MKKEMLQEVSFCDRCSKEEAFLEKCLSCGVEHCYDCTKKHGKSYSHGINAFGHGDGYYCNKCDEKLTKSKKDLLHNAYVAIVNLRKENEKWYADFKKRSEAAEDKIQYLLIRN